ncbi:5' exonuclease [Actinidia chinensis var. chinensis]|uniref:5' exonuclease n=1 Tax=Actinidia chinensis var. chinensis TaxID=1590841 RepID=A0A2R6RDK5_ACTCC|nr:5' exonuclease [Actinidia chinensis var. chinensis]
MDSIFKEEEAPFSHSCPQRPLPRALHTRLLPNLLYPSHQKPCPSTLLPGAVMFVFEGNFGNILHTGDCRLTPECLQSLPEKYIGKKGKEPRCRLDYVFLDCTFGKSSLKMPSKYSAVRQVINCIWKHPDARVIYLACDLLGQEEILKDVSKTFGSKIFVDKEKNPECFRALTLTAPKILSEDPSSHFQVLEGFPRLNERAKAKLAEAQANFQPEPLIIRPSAQWYVFDDEVLHAQRQRKEKSSEAVRDEFGVWHICFSMHSSREELEWALQILAPKRVVSTTPNCRAMDLYYVKKHCFGKQLASDDPLWKLLDIRPEASPISDKSTESVSCSSAVEDSVQPTVESNSLPVETSTNRKRLLTLSPPGKRSPVTLFGKARLGLTNSAFPLEENKTIPFKDECPHTISHEVETHFPLKEDIFELKHENSLENKTVITELHCETSVEKDTKFESKCENSMEIEVDVTVAQRGKSAENKTGITQVQCERSVEKDTRTCSSTYSPVGSSKSFNENFRKLYRSMNVPVPVPLPSLVQLMKANKRVKRIQF